MLFLLTSSWWVLVLRGVLLVLLGILSFAMPTATATSLVLYLSIYVILDGVMTILAGIMGNIRDENRWLVFLEGCLSIILGILLFRAPGTVLTTVALMFGGWLVFVGTLRMSLAIQLRKEMAGEIWLGLAGVCSILVGFLIFAQPELGVATLVSLVGVFALLTGVFLCVLGFRLRGLRGKVQGVVEGVRERISETTSP